MYFFYVPWPTNIYSQGWLLEITINRNHIDMYTQYINGWPHVLSGITHSISTIIMCYQGSTTTCQQSSCVIRDHPRHVNNYHVLSRSPTTCQQLSCVIWHHPQHVNSHHVLSGITHSMSMIIMYYQGSPTACQ